MRNTISGKGHARFELMLGTVLALSVGASLAAGPGAGAVLGEALWVRVPHWVGDSDVKEGARIVTMNAIGKDAVVLPTELAPARPGAMDIAPYDFDPW
jgi:hypothetical protein